MNCHESVLIVQKGKSADEGLNFNKVRALKHIQSEIIQ